MKKKLNFAQKSVFGILIGLMLMGSVQVEAIDLKATPSGPRTLPAMGTPWYTITGYDGSTYKVPYILRFSSTGQGTTWYNHYNARGMNLIYREDYGAATAYQPIPSAPYRVKSSYTWNDLYESDKNNASWKYTQAFWRTNSVRLNTVDCGQRENGTLTYGFGCILNAANGNPKDEIGNATTGHVSYDYGTRSNGTFGGTSGWGETRFIGYNEFGNVVDNTYFPMDNRRAVTAANYPYVSDIFTVQQNRPTKTIWDLAVSGEVRYQQKWDAIQRLIDQEGLSPNNPKSWMSRLSLLTNPITDAPVFKAMRDNGAGYHILVVTPLPSATMNVGITSMKIKDANGNVLAGMTRWVGSDMINIEFAGMAQNQRPKLEAGETYDLEVILTNGSETKTNATTQYLVVDGQSYTSCGSLAKGESCTFNIKYKAPDKEQQELKIESKVGDQYFDTGDNLNHDDDYATISIGVNKPPRGDLGVSQIQLIEAKSEKKVDYAIQGVEYYLLYEVQYVGDSMKGSQIDLWVDYTLDTYPRNADGSFTSNQVRYSTKTTNNPLQESSKDNPQTIYFKSVNFVATSSKISTEATIKGADFKWEYNDDKGGLSNTLSRNFSSPVNLKVSNVSVDPGSHPGGDYCGSFTINYGIDFKWVNGNPSGKPTEVQTVEVAFYNGRTQIGSTTIRVHPDQVATQRYSYTFNEGGSTVCVTPGSTLVVKVNPLNKLEESSLGDNEGSVVWNSAYAAGYCEAKRNNYLQWDQKYIVSTEKLEGFNENVGIFDRDDAITLNDQEWFSIKKIEMRSKLMTDKEMGPAGDGWVDALNAGSDKVQIKAGYGFDIRVTVEYETDAYIKEALNPILSQAPEETIYSPLKPIELFDNFYIKLPGSNRSLVSLDSNDVKLKREETVTKVGNKDRYTLVYTIEERTSSATGVETTSLFVNENTKDGSYQMTFYTSPVLGVPGKTPLMQGNPSTIVSNGHPTTYAPLCDSYSISFEVKGSVHDDLNINIIK